MTLYARSDLCSVATSRAHGGCGERHDRPVEDGAPIKLWALDCPQCETHLKTDVHWSGTISEIAETHDEKIVREDQEKRGQRELASATGNALEKLGSLPEILAQFVAIMAANGMANTMPIAAAKGAATRCHNGHDNDGTPKFCGECGEKIAYGRIVNATVEPPKSALSVGADDIAKMMAEFQDMNHNQLREKAKELGVPTTRSKADQLDLLAGHLSA